MKRVLAIGLVLGILFSFAACGEDAKKSDNVTKGTEPKGQSVTEQTAVDVAIAMFKAVKEDPTSVVNFVPEYDFPYLVAVLKADGWQPEEGLTDREAVVKMLADETAGEERAVSVELSGKELPKEEWPFSDLREIMREGLEHDPIDGVDLSLMDGITETTWVQINGTATYEDGRTETIENGLVLCVKIGGKWYADLFAMLTLGLG